MVLSGICVVGEGEAPAEPLTNKAVARLGRSLALPNYFERKSVDGTASLQLRAVGNVFKKTRQHRLAVVTNRSCQQHAIGF